MTIQSIDSEALRFQPEVLMAKDLRKSYGLRSALNGLSFSLKAGRVLGFLGPNGAGKTTTIRILTTILEPTSGQFSVAGIRSDEPEKIRQKIGVLPENLGFPKNLTGIEYLTFFGQLYGLSSSGAKAKATELLAEVGLKQRGKSLVGTYSHGMRQRLGIARALVNDPVVVFLDEPTLGLDPRGQQELLSLVKSIARDQNAGVILCSHLLAEVESVCDDVVILSLGEVVASGSVSEVIGRSGQKNVVRVRVLPSSLRKAQQLLEGTANVVKVTPATDMSGSLRVELVVPADGTQSNDYLVNNRILEALTRAGIPVLSFEGEGGRLQDVFLHLTAEAIK